MEEYFSEINKILPDAPFTETNRVFFEFMSKQEPYMEKLISALSYREFANRGFPAILRHNRERYNLYAAYTKEEQNIINNYLCTTSMNMYRQWIEDGKRYRWRE